MDYTTVTSFNTSCCDKCGRSLNHKGYIEVNGWKICGICQWESEQKFKAEQHDL